MEYTPHKYQKLAEKHIVDNNYSGLFLEMGLGKTVITLSAIKYLIYSNLEIDKVLVIAPKRVAENVWSDEVEKWDHLEGLKLSIVAGTESQRLYALKQQADIYVIGRDNIAWLVKHYMSKFPFELVVIDELSSFKNPKSLRFKALRVIRPKIKRVIGLTGTPAPNSLIDLWSQMYLIDQGERLGKHIGDYRREYFKPGKRNGQVVFNYDILKGSEQKIYDKIGDLCISMKTRDYIDLPERITNFVKVKLTKEQQAKYDDFEKEQVLKLLDEKEITALNAAGLTNKLLQYANGAVYDEVKQWYSVHDLKLEALEELIESAQGRPMIVAYSFRHDLERICDRFKARQLKTKEDIKEWNLGHVPLLVMHPASGGHGLNLQMGGSIITWFGPTWSLELHNQMNARIERPGQRDTCTTINYIIARDTMDIDVMRAIDRKQLGQDALMEAIKLRIKKYSHDVHN